MKPLNERKRRVLELLTLGRLTRKQAGEAVGVSDKTVGDWIRKDPEFNRQLEEWRSGPAPDATTVAQSKRIIIDELARRVLQERSQFTTRELLNIHALLTRESRHQREETDDDRDGGIELTPEQAERIWAELDGEAQRPQADAPDDQTQP